MILIFLVNLFNLVFGHYDWKQINLPPNHLPYFFNNNPNLLEQCRSDQQCPFKKLLNTSNCWGYENDCKVQDRMFMPECIGEVPTWFKDRQTQFTSFYDGGDFGYIRKKKNSMKEYCQPDKKKKNLSSLKCSKNAEVCELRNFYLDFKTANLFNTYDRYREDIIGPKQIGGVCKFNKNSWLSNGEYRSQLQSWWAELGNYTQVDQLPKCDIHLTGPTVFIKLDAGINMFHHFCDFVNLYGSYHIWNKWNQNEMQIVFWDTSSYDFQTFFNSAWEAFTNRPIRYIREFNGKKVCVKHGMFPLLARMRFGLYYNMPLTRNCYNTSLVKTFSEFFLHRLKIPKYLPSSDGKLQVTILERRTKYRNILNQDKLIEVLNGIDGIKVRLIHFHPSMNFKEQLKITQSSDVLVGMHGAGLTHLLFLPHWATIFEIYHCGDPDCYLDLARLRGVTYETWTDKGTLFPEDGGHHPTLGEHEKFTNYSFDPKEFRRKMLKIFENIRQRSDYQLALRESRRLRPKPIEEL
ncbi:hypothetical protein SNEBB_003303 [Seison nebaliae]|nr:hypothetical protein SNEBB_003303 [Seison nebaliae]